MTKERILLFVLFLALYSFLNFGQDSTALFLSINLLEDNQSIEKKLCECIDTPICISSVEFKADFSISSSELCYLLSFEKDKNYSHQDLFHFLLLLKKKNKIETIEISLKNNHAVFNLQGLWTFNKLKIGGFFGYKDKYYSYYALQAGEVFDKQKHEHSIKKLTEFFHKDGYYGVAIKDSIIYNDSTKTVNVYLSIDSALRYSIGKVDFVIVPSEGMEQYDVDLLKKKLIALYAKKILQSTYSQEMLNKQGELLGKYLTKKGFINARITLQENVNHKQKKIELVFTIELHSKKTFVFFGNQFFSNNALLEQIMVFGRLSWFLSPSILAEEIEDAYKAKGFLTIAVHPRQELNYFFFLINEGTRAVVKDVVFRGITHFNHKMVKKKFFSYFNYNAFFDLEKLTTSLSLLTEQYQKDGFWDFRVLKHELVPLQHGEYRLIIRVDEGMQRFLKEVQIAECPDVLQKSPFASIAKNEPLPFDVSILSSQRAWLIDYFQKQGYHSVQVKPEFDPNIPSINLTWHVSGIEKKVLFGKPILADAHTFASQYVLRELQFKEGDVWSKEALDASLMRLKRLGIFQSIRLYPVAWSDNFGQYQPVSIKVQEDDPFELRVRAGMQQVSENLTFRSGTTYKVGASLLYKNPFDFGDYVRADTDFTLFYRNVSLAYFRPWLCNVPVSTLFKAYTNKYNQPVIRGSKTTLYRVGQEGFLVEFSRYYKHVNTGTIFGLEFIETNKLTPEQAVAINFDQDLVDRNIPYFFCEPTIMIDYLDDKINPHSGTFTVVSLKTMVPWKKDAVPFFKVLAQQSFYVPVSHFFILAWRIRFGHIFNQEFRNIMPIERFYLGGENSLRSYQPDLAPPLGLLVEDDGKERLVPQGGRSMLNGNLEFRISFFGDVMFVLFQDVGALIEKEFSEVKGGRLLAASGFGFRYFTPIGPLRFDLGFKWHRDDPRESLVAWFLTLGHAFF